MKFKCKKRSKKSLDINYMPLQVIYIITAENWMKNLYFWKKNGNVVYCCKTERNFWEEKR